MKSVSRSVEVGLKLIYEIGDILKASKCQQLPKNLSQLQSQVRCERGRGLVHHDLHHSNQIHPVEIHPLPHLQHLPPPPSPPHLLVPPPSLRNDKYKRIFYYEFCDLARATHIYILNYDEQVTIVQKEMRNFMVTENNKQQMYCFVNRYMTYLID